jgi:tetratricopeptide (TPR) repeat protein
MPPFSQSSRIDRAGCAVLAAAAFLLPLVHSTRLADPFAFPKQVVAIAAALALFGCALLSRFTEDGQVRLITPALVLAGIVVAAAGLAALTAANRGLALWGFLEIASGAVLLWGVTRFARGPGAAALLFVATLMAAVLVAAGALAQVFYPGTGLAFGSVSLLPATRGGATLGEAGTAAQFLIAAAPAGLGAAALLSGWRRVACGGLVGFIAGALVFLGRWEGWLVGAALLGSAVVARILQVLAGDRRVERFVPDLAGPSLRAVLAGLIGVLLVVSFSRLSAALPGDRPAEPLRGVSLLAPTSGDPVADRAAAVPRTLSLVGRHPLGVGPGLFRHAFLEVAWTGKGGSPFSLSHQAVHAGNGFLEMTAETGVAGGLAFALLTLLVLAQAARAAARSPYPWDAAGFAAFLGVLALAFLAFWGAPFQEPAAAHLFWMFAGLAQVALAAAGAEGALPARLGPVLRPAPPRLLRARWVGMAGAAAWLLAAAAATLVSAQRAGGSAMALLGQAALQADRPDRALAALGRPEVRRLPDHLPRVLAANAYLRLGFHERAAEEFGEALRRSPYFIAARLGRAAARQAQGRYDLAEQDLDAALAIWPDNPETYVALGRLSVARGRLDLAIEHYRRAVQIDHRSAETYFLLGETYMRRGQIDEAIEAYRVCGMKNPRYPALHVHLGDAFYKKGLLEMALRYYQSAAGADPKAVEPRLRIAGTQHALGLPCEALEALKAARELEADGDRRTAILDLFPRLEGECAKAKKSPRPRPR